MLNPNQSPRSTWNPQDPLYETWPWSGVNTKPSFVQELRISTWNPTTQTIKDRSHTCTKDYSGSANFLPTSTVKREISFYWFPENKLHIWRVNTTQ